MKRSFSYLILAMLFAVIFASCSKGSITPEIPDKPGPPPETPAKTFVRFDQGSLTIGAFVGDQTIVEFLSNSDVFEVYTEPAITWANVKIQDKKLIATATTENPVFETNSVVVYIKAGVGDDTKTTSIVLLQLPVPEPDATLTLTPSTVLLSGSAGVTKTVAIESNKTSFAAVIDVFSAEWLSATISGTTITFKTLASNTTGADRSATVTITATGVDKSISKVVEVTQENSNLPTGLSIGALYGGGMIYGIVRSVNNDADTVKIVSLNDLDRGTGGTQYVGPQWATSNIIIWSMGDETNRDGKMLTEKIKNHPSYPAAFPAAAACASLGADWFLPTRYDITLMYTNGVRSYMGVQPGSTAFQTTYHNTSNQRSNGNVECWNPSNNLGTNTAPTTRRPTRAVKWVVVTVIQ